MFIYTLDKSLSCPNFLDKITKDKLHYFVRGFFDGDGCFYVNENNNQKQCVLAGSYDQDWTWIEDILKKLNIKYSIKRKIQKSTEKYSIVYINKNGIKIFGDYITYIKDTRMIRLDYQENIINF